LNAEVLFDLSVSKYLQGQTCRKQPRRVKMPMSKGDRVFSRERNLESEYIGKEHSLLIVVFQFISALPFE
jgi:hypothetical protein